MVIDRFKHKLRQDAVSHIEREREVGVEAGEEEEEAGDEVVDRRRPSTKPSQWNHGKV